MKERPDVKFRLVGDGSLRPELEAQVRALGLSPVLSLPGWSEDALGEILGMDIYVASSVTDTTNLTVLEATGLGKPVVASNVGGISDAVVDHQSGFLVPPRRPDLLAQAMLRLTEDPALREKMGASGRELFERRFIEDRMLAEHKELYEELLTSVQREVAEEG
jgi:glycosyltransferase involved in cell wall biosynthesis